MFKEEKVEKDDGGESKEGDEDWSQCTLCVLSFVHVCLFGLLSVTVIVAVDDCLYRRMSRLLGAFRCSCSRSRCRTCQSIRQEAQDAGLAGVFCSLAAVRRPEVSRVSVSRS